MDNLTSTRHKGLLTALLIAFNLIVFQSFASVEDGDAANGKKLFQGQCAACHKLDKPLVGPAMQGITEKRDIDWLKAWIRDNAKLRASGDQQAIDVYNEWNGIAMPAFPLLSDQDIYDILAYTEKGDQKKSTDKKEGETDDVAAADSDSNQLPLIIGLSVLLLLLIILLLKVRSALQVMKGEEPTGVSDDVSVFTRALVKNRFVMTLLTIVVVVWLLNAVYWYLMGIGVTGGEDQLSYQPEQPIAFSHKVHAGENGIDCNYCHSSARYSKTSGIPSANVCMNCHMYIDGSEIAGDDGEPKYGGDRSPEIAKIYEAIGWDGETRSYIEGYEQKPIRWIRVHNLPNLAYFNHAQHVTAGQLECQTCHGPIQEMEEVYQFSPLTMGWCIDCHRTENVKLDNGYYDDMKENLKEKYHSDKIHPSQIGGLECGKCHY